MKVSQLCPTLQPHGLYSPWNSPGKNTGVGSLSLLQGIFQAQGLNPGLLHCRWVLYQMSTREALKMVVQFSSVTQSCSTLCDPMNRSTPGLPVHYQLLDFTQIHVHGVSDAIQPSHPLSSPLLISPIPPSVRVFTNKLTLHIRWPKYWSFGFSISPSKEHRGLISFRMDWLDLLAVQGTLKSLLQHHSSKASILQGSAFFTVQLSHPYMTTGKTIALTRRTFVGKVMYLFFNVHSSSIYNCQCMKAI